MYFVDDKVNMGGEIWELLCCPANGRNDHDSLQIQMGQQNAARQAGKLVVLHWAIGLTMSLSVELVHLCKISN